VCKNLIQHCFFHLLKSVVYFITLQIRHHLTEPLMAIVSELNRQKNDLVTLLKSKDREIADLKAQGVSVSRSEYCQFLFMLF